jgi:hypothetical protein
VAWSDADPVAMLNQIVDEAGRVLDEHPGRTLTAAAVVTIVALAGWAAATAKRRRLAREVDALTLELAEARAKYQSELKWRTATERYQARQSGSQDPKRVEDPAAASQAASGTPLPDAGVAPRVSPRPRRSQVARWALVLLAGVAAVALWTILSPDTAHAFSPYGTGLISVGIVVFLLSSPLAVIALYFCPSLLAGYRQHARGSAILALNFLFGWTGVGWIIALLWSVRGASARAPS